MATQAKDAFAVSKRDFYIYLEKKGAQRLLLGEIFRLFFDKYKDVAKKDFIFKFYYQIGFDRELTRYLFSVMGNLIKRKIWQTSSTHEGDYFTEKMVNEKVKKWSKILKI